MDPQRTPTRLEILNYEVKSSWWANLVSWRPLQTLAGRYFARKVNRKYNRLLYWQDSSRRIAELKAKYGIE